MARLVLSAFDPQAELAAFTAGRHDAGALASFVGLVRGKAGDMLELEHYPGFTDQALNAIEADARERFHVINTLVIHRAGIMKPGEVIVLAAALSAHRKEALAAVDFLMDRLKTDAPFWKKETHEKASEWIEPRRDDYAARAAWEEKT